MASGLLVLVVDDNADNRDMCEQYLRFAGCRVETASDGNEGVVKAGALRPDAIVMDLGMPRLDGWEATRRLKADPATRDIPIIVVSAHAYRDDRVRATAAGADTYLVKPLSPQELLRAIRLMLPGPAQ
jgi:two-component system cell cycle response regulator DivK